MLSATLAMAAVIFGPAALSAGLVTKVLSEKPGNVRVEITFPEPSVRQVTIEGKSFSQLSMAGASPLQELGLPEVLTFSRNIRIPRGADYQVSIVQKETSTRKIPPIVPSRGALSRCQDNRLVPYSFTEVYQSAQSFPGYYLKARESFTLRRYRGVGVTIFPVQYNFRNNRATFLRRIIFDVSYRGGDNRGLSGPVDPGFKGLYSARFLNPDPSLSVAKEQWGPILYVTHSRFKDGLAGLVDWQRQKGRDTEVMVADGMDADAIKAQIKARYDSTGLAYVNLVGDAEFVPFFPGQSGNARMNEADPLYATVDGDDSYPDLFVGRISVQSEDELATVVAKTIQYEKSPEQGGSWYQRAAGIASDEGSPTDAERAEILKELLLGWRYNDVSSFYDPGASARDLADDINQGLGFINYIGHGSKSTWVTTGFGNQDIDELDNGTRQPFIVSVACVNGDFSGGGDAFAERWLKAGNSNAPKGAIAVFASSTNQSWVPPTVGQKAIVEFLTSETYETVGSLFFNGSIAVLDDQSSSAKQTFETWHIFGDASLQVRTSEPRAIAVHRMPELSSLGSEAHVGEAGIDLGVDVRGKLVAVGRSDKDGVIAINGLVGVERGDPLRLTFTGKNRIPHIVHLRMN